MEGKCSYKHTEEIEDIQQGECSYNGGVEEKEIQRWSSACSQTPPASNALKVIAGSCEVPRDPLDPPQPDQACGIGRLHLQSRGVKFPRALRVAYSLGPLLDLGPGRYCWACHRMPFRSIEKEEEVEVEKEQEEEQEKDEEQKEEEEEEEEEEKEKEKEEGEEEVRGK